MQPWDFPAGRGTASFDDLEAREATSINNL